MPSTETITDMPVVENPLIASKNADGKLHPRIDMNGYAPSVTAITQPTVAAIMPLIASGFRCSPTCPRMYPNTIEKNDAKMKLSSWTKLSPKIFPTATGTRSRTEKTLRKSPT